MSTEKVIAILAALLADQENVKVSYEIHKDNYAEKKPPNGGMKRGQAIREKVK